MYSIYSTLSTVGVLSNCLVLLLLFLLLIISQRKEQSVEWNPKLETVFHTWRGT